MLEPMSKRDRIKKHRKTVKPGERRWHRDFFEEPSGTGKMSEAIQKLADPWLDEATNDEETEAILNAAATAWNLSLVPPQDRNKALQQTRFRLPKEQQDWLQEMVRRKETLFPANRRVVQSVWLQKQAGEPSMIQALSTLEPLPVGQIPSLPFSRPGFFSRLGLWLRRLLRRA